MLFLDSSLPSSITVFGGSGFLGRALVPALAQAGIQKNIHIRVAVRDPQAAASLRVGFLPSQIEIIPYNPRQESSLAKTIAGSEAVINLIGILHENKRGTFQTAHVETAARIARIAKEQQVKSLIHISALGASLHSDSRYARSKATGEEAVRAFFPEATIFRPSLIFGAGDLFLNRFAAISRFSPFLPLIGGGATQFQPVYIGDVVAAILVALRDKNAKGKTFSLGGPHTYSFQDLLRILCDTLARKKLLLSLPWSLSNLIAMLSEFSDKPFLTRDQIRMLKSPNILTQDETGRFADLGIRPVALEMMLPALVQGFRAV